MSRLVPVTYLRRGVRVDVGAERIVVTVRGRLNGGLLALGGVVWAVVIASADTGRASPGPWSVLSVALGAGCLAAGVALLMYRRCVVVKLASRQIGIYQQDRLVRSLGFDEAIAVVYAMGTAWSNGPWDFRYYFVQLALPGEQVDVCALNSWRGAYELAWHIARVTGKPLDDRVSPAGVGTSAQRR